MKLNEMNEKSFADLNMKYDDDIDCSQKELTSLKGAPEIVKGKFDSSYNKLISLEGAPKEVGSFFSCAYNRELTSLEGGPEIVGSNFFCMGNKLYDLEGAPQLVGGSFVCNNNNISSLKGVPKELGSLDCSYNNLTSLEGAPQRLSGNFFCHHNKRLTSLKNIHRHIRQITGIFSTDGCPIQSHVLGLLLIKDLQMVALDNEEVRAIINAHLDGGSMRSAMDCQHALIKAGFPEFAKL